LKKYINRLIEIIDYIIDTDDKRRALKKIIKENNLNLDVGLISSEQYLNHQAINLFISSMQFIHQTQCIPNSFKQS